jgi:MraZ protein
VEAGKAVNYSGQGFSLLGEKGRFVLPPDFRKAVRDSGQGERVLCLTTHPRWNCLMGFGLSRIGDRSTQLNSFAKVPFDDSGRFVLPERYFKLGAITTGAYFQGGGKFFTIWNPDELAKMGAGWEDAQAACAELAAQAQSGKGRK